jgi:hypothetical protein
VKKLYSICSLALWLGVTAAFAQQPITAKLGYYTAVPGAPASLSISEMSIDFAQVLNIGAQATGAGAGKATFNPLTVKRDYDPASPYLFQAMCQGTPFKTLTLKVGAMTMTLGLVAVKSVTFSADLSGRIIETDQFVFGGVNIADAMSTRGWNIVKNLPWNDPGAAIQ